MKSLWRVGPFRLFLSLGISISLIVLGLSVLAEATTSELDIQGVPLAFDTQVNGLLEHTKDVSLCNPYMNLAPGNIVPNASFEGGFSWRDWHKSGDCTFLVVQAPVYSGTLAAKIDSTYAPRDSECKLFIPGKNTPIEPGRAYDYSAWVKAALQTGYAFLRVQFWSYVDDGWVFKGWAETTKVKDTGDEWQLLTGSVIAPRDAEYARVDAVVNQWGKGEAYFDEVILRNSACLTMTKTYSPSVADPGFGLDFTITYKNIGREPARDIRVAELYDEDLTLVRASPDPSYSNNTWVITYLGKNESGQIRLFTQLEASALGRAQLENVVDMWSEDSIYKSQGKVTVKVTVPVSPVERGCDVRLRLPLDTPLVQPDQTADVHLGIEHTHKCKATADLEIATPPGWKYNLEPSPPYLYNSEGITPITLSLSAYQYAAPGIYQVYLTAQLNCTTPCTPTSTDQKQFNVIVSPPPPLRHIYLPVVKKEFLSCLPGGWEQEHNDSYSQANGPLCPETKYGAELDDDWDFFYIYLPKRGDIQASLTITAVHVPEDIQLQLRDETGTTYDYAERCPYKVQLENAPPGKYYILVYRNIPADPPYELVASFPWKP